MNLSTTTASSRLSGNQLKLIALIAMTCDHVSKSLLPQWVFLQIIGRLAFPIFAFMIAEGCRYTKNRAKYLLSMASLALVCQLVYFFVMGSLYQCVLVTFSLSMGLIFLSDNALRQKTFFSALCALLGFSAVFFLCEVLPGLLPGTNYRIDYSFWGVLLPVLVYLGKDRKQQLLLCACGLVLLNFYYGGIQWYSLATLVLLAMYSGKRGKRKMKYLFYIYYPTHLVVIHFLGMLIFSKT